MSCVCEQISSTSENILWLIVSFKNFKLLLANVYFAPINSSSYGDEDLLSVLQDELLMNLANKNISRILVMGDLNGRVACKPDYDINDSDRIMLDEPQCWIPPERSNRDTVVNARGQSILNFCKRTGLCIVNGRIGQDKGIGQFTCIKYNGKSAVDFMLTNEENFSEINDFEILNRVDSDHMPMSIVINYMNINPDMNACKNIGNDKHDKRFFPRVKWNDEKSNNFFERMNSDLTNENLRGLSLALDSGQPNEALDIMYNTIWYCCDEMIAKVPRSVNFVAKQPWFDFQCYNAKCLAEQCLNDLRDDKIAVEQYWDAKSNYNDMRKLKKMEFKNNSKLDLLEAASNKDSKKFWFLLNGRKSNIGNDISPNDWVQYFSELFSSDPSPPMGVVFGPQRDTTLLDQSFSIDEVVKSINSSKSGKSGGIDGIPNEVWKASVPICSSSIQKLFNYCYDECYFPSKWQESIIVPIYKKGPVNDPNNYRGIWLQSHISKIFTTNIFSRLKYFVESNSIITDFQAAFRSNYSTTDNIFILMSIIQKTVINSNQMLYTCFVDFRKAFDLVSREKLWWKMRQYGISTKMINMIKQIYSSVSACIKIDPSHTTSNFESCDGLKQGDVLSGIAFVLYLNDLIDFFIAENVSQIVIAQLYITLLLFADDLALFDQSARGLQRKINLLYKYCQEWNLQINVSKTKVLVFRNSVRTQIRENWYLNGQTLETVNEYKYLGVLLHCTGTWTLAKNDLVSRATRAVCVLWSNVKKFGYMPQKTLLSIFDSKVLPILLYGSEIWGVDKYDEIEKVANNFYRQLLGMNKNCSVTFIRGELGRYSLMPYILTKIISYWIKIVRCPEQRAIYQCYRHQLELVNNEIDCWALSVRNILFMFGFGDVWITQNVGNCNAFIIEFKKRSKCIDAQNWHGQVLDLPSMRFYSTIKNDLKLEWYLDIGLSRERVNLIARFRGCLLRIGVNEGRWQGVQYENRKCKLCNSNEIDDELHFLFRCRAWSGFRSKLLDYDCFKNECAFDIFEVKNKKLMIELFYFLKNATEMRKEILEVI